MNIYHRPWGGRLPNAVAVVFRLLPLYVLAAVMDWQDRKAGAR